MPSRKYPQAKYSFDTNAFIESRKTWYKPSNFISLWNSIDEHIKNRVIIATILVKKEIEKVEDSILEYVNNFKMLFKNPTEEEQEVVKKIVNNSNFRKWAQGGLNQADPFVIALAKVHKLCVVTYDNK
jgi:hypothetical protein